MSISVSTSHSVTFASKVNNNSIDEDKINHIHHYIEANLDHYNIPGMSIGIMKNGQPIFLKGYGIANREQDPVTPQTPFILGSTSKSFTAIALLQLVEQGLVDLDSPIVQYLPLFPNEKIKNSEFITVRHLLNQTSGFSEADGIKDLADKPDYTLAERFLRHKNLDLTTFPGESYQYSNLNYLLVGWIIETVTNQSLNAYIQSNILIPLNMNHSFTNYEEAQANGLAEGYSMWLGKPFYKHTNYLSHDVATGYIISSAEDMLTYLSAHYYALKQQPMSQTISTFTISELFTPVAKADENSAYGMGWFIDLTSKDKSHSGDLEHFFSSMALFNENETDHWGIVMLVNANAALTQAPLQYQMFDDIVSIIKDQEVITIEKGANFSQYLYNAILIILILLSVVQFYVDMKIRQRAKQKHFNYFKTIRMVLIFKTLVIIGLAFLLPSAINAPLSVIYLFQPDFGFVLITTLMFTIVALFIHLFYSKRNVHK